MHQQSNRACAGKPLSIRVRPQLVGFEAQMRELAAKRPFRNRSPRSPCKSSYVLPWSSSGKAISVVTKLAPPGKLSPYSSASPKRPCVGFWPHRSPESLTGLSVQLFQRPPSHASPRFHMASPEGIDGDEEVADDRNHVGRLDAVMGEVAHHIGQQCTADNRHHQQ